ncbi:DUF1028 domain-containing protein [Corynebacterium sp. YIM 101645]|uniref:DUF1028 domain-containing protein n=1 Tax=Corynebacterium lemuris TaxID=1859292 RepID=A0ABT2G028_9CORY|nr:DUF1028 domain-containing protein [Corynebacterium lemuris]MCS5480854.1 DUF1028 domain-containing protein [Corynebacterium lemuris]
MTFSILARDPAGAIGMAVSSSSPAVAARCLHLQGGVGGVASQNITDPRFGPALLSRLSAGDSAAQALDWLAGMDDTLDYRQISILPQVGEGVTFSGGKTLGTHHARVGVDAVVAGNMLAGSNVIDVMLDTFERSIGDLETRLLDAMNCGLAAGGEAGPIHSAGLAVVRGAGWAETDLRVDWSETPLEDLTRLLDEWLPQRDDYVTRGLNPSTSPSYGVPGDE